MLVTGNDIVKWVEKRTNGFGFENPHGIGIIRNNILMGGIVYDNYRPAAKTICISTALDDKRALSKEALRHIFEFAYFGLDCNRIQALIVKSNQPSIDLCRRLGFVHEGVLREASPKGEDVLLFAMLKRECKWLHNNSSNTSNS